MHFKKNQYLRSGGGNTSLDFAAANTPQQVGDCEEWGPAGRSGPLLPAPRAGVRCTSQGPVTGAPGGVRPSSSLQDGTGYDSLVCAPASLIFPSFQKQIERSLI